MGVTAAFGCRQSASSSCAAPAPSAPPHHQHLPAPPAHLRQTELGSDPGGCVRKVRHGQQLARRGAACRVGLRQVADSGRVEEEFHAVGGLQHAGRAFQQQHTICMLATEDTSRHSHSHQCTYTHHPPQPYLQACLQHLHQRLREEREAAAQRLCLPGAGQRYAAISAKSIRVVLQGAAGQNSALLAWSQ